MPALNGTTLTLLALLPLLAWRVVVRVKRMIGRQKLSRVRPWVTLVLFPLLLALLCFMARGRPDSLAWLAGAVPAGLLLAVVGLKTTVFEKTPGALYYTPNAHLGIVLSLLFVGRIVWRLVQVFMMTPAQLQQPDDFSSSPLTLAIFGLLAGYYIGYAIGLLRWRFAVLRAKRERERMQAEQQD